MSKILLEQIEKDYQQVKSSFQNKDPLSVSYAIADEISEQKEILKEVFDFLVPAFSSKLRNDGKTPLVFHSIYLTKLMYLCGEKEIESLLIPALHDVLEDTDISEEKLLAQDFVKGHEKVLKGLRTLKEDKNLSREPNGKNLPPRYVEHISRIINAPREVINTEIIDRFSDLMDLEYILILPEKDRGLRLKSKLIKVKSFVYNITKNRKDFNKSCLRLFEEKVRNIEKKFNVNAEYQEVSAKQ